MDVRGEGGEVAWSVCVSEGRSAVEMRKKVRCGGCEGVCEE